MTRLERRALVLIMERLKVMDTKDRGPNFGREWRRVEKGLMRSKTSVSKNRQKIF